MGNILVIGDHQSDVAIATTNIFRDGGHSIFLEFQQGMPEIDCLLVPDLHNEQYAISRIKARQPQLKECVALVENPTSGMARTLVAGMAEHKEIAKKLVISYAGVPGAKWLAQQMMLQRVENYHLKFVRISGKPSLAEIHTVIK